MNVCFDINTKRPLHMRKRKTHAEYLCPSSDSSQGLPILLMSIWRVMPFPDERPCLMMEKFTGIFCCIFLCCMNASFCVETKDSSGAEFLLIACICAGLKCVQTSFITLLCFILCILTYFKSIKVFSFVFVA